MLIAITALTNWGSTDLTHQIEHRTWPDFRQGGFYLDMIDFAEEAIGRATKTDQLAAILIYQQLAEEWLHAVDYWCFFENSLVVDSANQRISNSSGLLQLPSKSPGLNFA